MEIQLALAANKKLVPTGHTMAGYEIQKDGSPLMTIGGKGKWTDIEADLHRLIPKVGDVHLIIFIRAKSGDITTSKTLYTIEDGNVVEK